MTARLIVVGAGPKGLSLAAKAHALARAGWQVPEIVLVDRAGVAANWLGRTGYTDGDPTLGTAPEKDLGFPYAASWGESSAAVNAAMGEVSWHSYLVDVDDLAEWVDRGRPGPTHRRWGRYLTWAAGRLGVDPVRGRVDRIEARRDGWAVRAASDDGPVELEGTGLVLTGPGPPVHLPGQPSAHPRVLDGRQFWMHVERLRPRHVCVVGSGETAGAVAVVLTEIVGAGGTVELVSREGVLYTRGESFTENHLFSDPSQWLRLPERYRRSFLRRTDRGVFSTSVQHVLDGAETVRAVAGRVVSVSAEADAAVVEIDDTRETTTVAYDLVVVAVGFDPLWFLELTDQDTAAALRGAVGYRGGGHGDDPDTGLLHAVEDGIGADLAVSGMAPALHLPVVAGVAQGPGFPNLSCLGLLADRVLRRHVRSPAETHVRSTPSRTSSPPTDS